MVAILIVINYGTEGRSPNVIPPNPNIIPTIIFQANDILELHAVDSQPQPAIGMQTWYPPNFMQQQQQYQPIHWQPPSYLPQYQQQPGYSAQSPYQQSIQQPSIYYSQPVVMMLIRVSGSNRISQL